MIRLVYSDRAERLVEALIENIEAGKIAGRRAPLDPVDILVPSRAAPAWLKLEIARRTGIAANLRFDFLERFLARAIEEAKRPKKKLRVAGGEVLQAAILRVLLDPDAMRAESLAPVVAYVSPPGGVLDEDTADVRRFQLSQQLARVFADYVIARREMLRAWHEGLVFADGAFRELEAWQRTLWLRVAASLTPDVLVLPDAFDRVGVEELPIPRELHVFAARIASPVVLSMVARLGRVSEVFLYALNPVKEFWDDYEAGETPALRLWGRAGRESIRLFNELSEGDFGDRFSPGSPANSLLGTFVQDVLHRRPERSAPSSAPDPSFTFLSCPGARREIEVIAGEIWSLVRSSSIRFNEIAVVLAGRDRELYRAHAGSVFQETHGIPHHFIDIPMRGTSRVLEAIDLLLALPFSGFTRQDLLRLVLHPSVRAVLGEVDPRDWLRWLDSLTVLHGADHADHADTYIEKDLYNWDQGLRRLVLGTFLSGERTGDTRAFEHGGQHYLPEEASLDRIGSVSRLVTLVRSLVADARYVRGAKMTLGEWAELIAHLVTSYVGRAEDDDERDLQKSLAVIHELAKLDPFVGPVSFRIASELVRAALGRLTMNRGQPLADGVAIASLDAISFVPFRVVFLAGLGEGQFPASDRRSRLDLRAAERKTGDVTPREEDEYLFLERVLATSERVYVSWVSRDARTGDELAPSSIVLELKHVLERGYAKPVIEIAHPLRRHEEEVRVSPSAESEHGAVALRSSLLAALDGNDGRIPDLARLRREMDPLAFAPLAKRLGLAELPGVSADATEGTTTIQVPYGAIRRFLEDPCEGWMRQVLRLRENDRLEDPLAREDEAFSATALDATILLREVFAEKLAHPTAEFAELYDRRALELELRGVLATGVFGRADRERHLALLASWEQTVSRLEGAFEDSLRFGRAQENVAVKETTDPIVVELALSEKRKLRVELHGRTEISVGGAAVLPFMRASDGALVGEKDGLRGFLDHVLFTMLGRVGRRSVFVMYSQGEPIRIAFEPISPEDAAGYLRSVLADLLTSTHAYHLPFEEVLGAEPKRSRLPRLPAELEKETKERRFGLYFKIRRSMT